MITRKKDEIISMKMEREKNSTIVDKVEKQKKTERKKRRGNSAAKNEGKKKDDEKKREERKGKDGSTQKEIESEGK